MNQKTDPAHFEVCDTYVEWANTLDSAGQDSVPARGRMRTSEMVEAILFNMQNIAKVGRMSDDLKKYIFYGKATSQWNRVPRLPEMVIDTICDRMDDHNMMRVYHALLGLITEAAELMEMFQGYISEGKEFDWVNFTEEVGDLFWYMALLARAQGYGTFIPYLASNRAKLVARYGDKWSQDKALNRDVQNEMNELKSVGWPSEGTFSISVGDKVSDPMPYDIDPEIVQTVIKNLTTNSLRVDPVDGAVEVDCTTDEITELMEDSMGNTNID